MNAGGSNDTQGSPQRKRHVSAIKLLVPSAMIAVMVTLWSLGFFEKFSLAHLISHRDSLKHLVASHYPAAVLGFVILYVVLVALSFPGASIMTILGGLLFGGIIGALYSAIGATMGAVIVFLVARSSFGSLLGERAGPFMAGMMDGFQKEGFNYLLMLRLAPVFPFWVVNIVPGLLNMQLKPYVLATAIGILPGGLAYSFIGAGLVSIIDAQELAHPGCAVAGTCTIDLKALVTPQITAALFLLALISCIPVIIRRLASRKTGN